MFIVYKQLGKNFAVFIVGADLRVCPGVTSYTAAGADLRVGPRCHVVHCGSGPTRRFANLQNPSQRAWVLGNIALASYAKVGGAPWVVADSSGRHELVMGASRAQEETNNSWRPEDNFACSSEIGVSTA
jgi:hypothetical protein